MRTITDDQIIDTLQELATERPDYVYEQATVRSPRDGTQFTTCAYTTEAGGETAPSCIVGHAMLRLGGDLQVMRLFNFDSVSSLLRHLSVKVSDDAEQLLETVQHQQDEGTAWGEAVKSSLEYVYNPAGV